MIQLISPLWGPLASQQAAQALSDSNTDFLVVGVCSSDVQLSPALVAMLAGRPPATTTTASTDSSQQLPGLRMHVSPRDRIITLDATAMLSPGLLTALTSSNRPQPAVGSSAAAAVRAAARKAAAAAASSAGGSSSSSSVPVEGVALLLTLQLLVFLCAVCNVVIISSECIDLQLLQLLEGAGLIAASIPSITAQPQTLNTAMQQQQQQQQQQPPAAATGNKSLAAGRSRQTPQQQQQQQAGADAGRGGRRQGAAARQQATAAMPSPPTVTSTTTAAAAGVRPGEATPSAAASNGHVADLVLLQCCRSQQQLRPVCLQRLHEVVDACLASTAWACRPPAVLPPAAAAAAAAAIPSQSHLNQQQQQCAGMGVCIWAAPVSSSSSSSTTKSSSSPAAMTAAHSAPTTSSRPPVALQQLVSQLLHHPRGTQAASSSAVAGGGSNVSSRGASAGGVFSRVFTEGEWLRCAERVWDAVQDSSELLQYYRAVAETRLVGAGGWSSAAAAAAAARFDVRQHVSPTNAALGGSW